MSEEKNKRGYGPDDNHFGGSSWMEFLLDQASVERKRQIAGIKAKITREPLEIITKKYEELNKI